MTESALGPCYELQAPVTGRADNHPAGTLAMVYAEVTPAQGTRALVKCDTLYSLRRASAGGTVMAWRAGNRQARSALRARSAVAANRLAAAKVFCIQWARTAPRKLSTARPTTMPAAALTSAMRAATHRTCARGAPSARRTPNSVVR